MLDNAKCKVETYGWSHYADWSLANYRFENGQSCFTLLRGGKESGDFHLPMIGRHNALNATAVAAMCIRLGLTATEIDQGFRAFQGIRRRQEVVAEKNGVTVIDDFAHHPTAIGMTVNAVREAYPDRRLWAIYEPRSATSRRNTFQDILPESFNQADIIVLAGLFTPDKIKPEDRLDPQKVVDLLDSMNKEAHFIAEVDNIVDHVTKYKQSGDIVLVMSCGGFDGIHQKLLAKL